MGPISSKITVAKEKERRKRKKERGGRKVEKRKKQCLHSQFLKWLLWKKKKLFDTKDPFAGNVFKNPARYTCVAREDQV